MSCLRTLAILKTLSIQCAALTLLLTAASAQVYYGTILGTARDTTGAVQPGVAVTVVNLDTNVTSTVTTNEVGNYSIPNLNPGQYQLTAEQTGFKRFVFQAIELKSAQEARVDIPMELGVTTESVTVTAGGAILETERATISESRSNFEFNHMAVNSNYRSIWRLLTLSPGVSGSNANVIAGNQRGSNSTFTIDGVPMIDGWSGGAIGPAFTYLDGYREFRIDLSSVGASTGTTAAVSVVSESGTNEYHGEGWLHYNAIGWVARPFFAPTSANGPPIYRPNFKIGGPIRLPLYDGRDRTFFHFTYQGLRGSQLPQTSNFAVPTTAFRQGDFSSLSTPIADPSTGEPFAGNVIPAARINPVSKYFQDNFYPAANNGASQFSNIAVFPNTDDQYVGRLDHKISDSNTIFGRVMYHHYVFQNLQNGNPNVGIYDQYRDQQNIVISDTHAFSANLFNELRFGFGKDDSAYHGPRRGREIVSASGLQLGDVPDVFAFPSIDVTGYQTLAQSDQGGWTWDNYYVVEGLHYVRGKHNFHFGVDWANLNGTLIPTSPSAAYGSYSFDGRFSGNPYADFLLGIMNVSSRSTSVSPVYRHRTNWAFHVTDSFKVSPTLTLDFGLRYSLLDPGYTERSLFANFDPSVNALVVPDDAAKNLIHPGFPANVPIVTADAAGLPGKLVRFDKNNFAPRFGFAWRPTAGTGFVVRGGAGVYYVALQPNPSDGGGAPYEVRESFTNILSGGSPQFSFPNPFPTSGFVLGGTSASGMNNSLRTPYSLQYNLTVEKELSGIALSGSYVSTMSRKNTWTRNLNQPVADTRPYATKFQERPFGYLAAANFTENGGSHNYNALMLKAERHYKSGLFFTTHLTWARSVGDDWGSVEDAFDRRRERSQGGLIAPVRFVASGLYELPVGTGKPLAIQSKVLNAVFGGWLVGGTWVSQAGTYFTPSYSGSDPSNTNRFSGRPDRIADGNLSEGARSLNQWFDTTAFVVPAGGIGRFGTAGGAILQAPSLNVLHATVSKEVTFHERFRMRLEAVSTNVLNHPNFGEPNGTVGSPVYGRVLGTVSDDGNRNLQIAVRLIF